MVHPKEIYDLLLDYGNTNTPIKEIFIGLTWTLCETESIGLCMSPGTVTRTLPWSGTLVNKPVKELAPWLRSWNSFEATVGMAAINAEINGRSQLPTQAEPLSPYGPGNLAVFEYFLPMIRGKKVAIIGRYPRLSRYENEMEMTVIERQPGADDLPDTASEYLLPEAEWVFLTATSIANKTFPRLVELAKDSQLVLMGPTMPWLTELKEFGIDYLAGVTVSNSQALRQTVAEGGGVRIFETGVQYQVLKL
ncbi:Rossmann-like domain-containing protein [Dapis sp. BLCC M126]|uniref:Rossmann-like domain-containing protein n=1 Tax=Dapis sp. BLCC M126 TaxID=3400189 RepID=UPI003CF46FD5